MRIPEAGPARREVAVAPGGVGRNRQLEGGSPHKAPGSVSAATRQEAETNQEDGRV